MYVKERLLGERFEYIELYREYNVYIYIYVYIYIHVLFLPSNFGKIIQFGENTFQMDGKKDQLMFWVSDYLDYPPYVI